jgi:hypothetical protein
LRRSKGAQDLDLTVPRPSANIISGVSASEMLELRPKTFDARQTDQYGRHQVTLFRRAASCRGLRLSISFVLFCLISSIPWLQTGATHPSPLLIR